VRFVHGRDLDLSRHFQAQFYARMASPNQTNSHEKTRKQPSI